MGQGGILAITETASDFAAVLVTGTHVAHVDERGIDDALIEGNAVIRNDLAEGLDEEFPT